jgi:hypothetical protein
MPLATLPFWTMAVLSFAVLAGVSLYVHRRRQKVDEMHGMMVGMVLGMMAGLIPATLLLIPTGNFLLGTIAGSVIGLAFGALFGRLGGHLGVMEGVIAGPMGGMMGAMLGQMMRPFNIEVFMPFFTSIVLLTLAGISYAVHCGVSCCDRPAGQRGKAAPVSETFITAWILAGIIVIGLSVALPFSASAQGTVPSTPSASGQLSLPPALQQLTQETRATATLKDGYQEVDLQVTPYGYEPNTILAKKGIPLRINARADPDAGCGRDLAFPEFGINAVIPEDGVKTITLDLTKAGEFSTLGFRCSMDMLRGKIMVE